MWKVRELADKVTNVVMNYTEIEAKVREATNDDPWGPTGTLRHELAQATFSYDQFPEVMGMLWKRIAENKRSPRRVYKSLLLVHHLLLNGSDRVIRATTDRLYEIRQLQDYHVVYEPGFNFASIIPVDEYKDGETNVRVKAKEIVELVQDEERLREERKKAKKNRDKYVGIGSDRSMSKWNDFDDELEFPKKSASKYYDDFEGGGTGGDEDSSLSTTSNQHQEDSKSKSNNRESPKSLNIKFKAQDDDEFNPRAHELKSSKGNSLTKGNVDSVKIGRSTGTDFADFQSAFGNEPNSSNSGANTTNSVAPTIGKQMQDSSEFFLSPVSVTPQSSSNGIDLLGLDLNTSVMTTPFAAQSHHQVIGHSNTSATSVLLGPTATTPSNSVFDAFQSFQSSSVSGGQNQGQSSVASTQGSTALFGFGAPDITNFQNIQQHPNFQSNQQLPITSPSSVVQTPTNILFSPNNSALGVGDHFGLLQPTHANNLNNNHMQGAIAGKSGTTNKKALEGTTWSDLNISIDDLNLSSRKSKPAIQPAMNQLFSSPTRSSKPL